MLYIIYGILILILFGIDQLTKVMTHNNFLEGETVGVITDFFHLTYVKNYGVAFGMFQGKIPMITIGTVIAVLVVGFLLIKNIKKSALENTAYCFILAGAFGNMYDRATRGYVVDMIDFRGIWAYVFNVADVYINIGVFLLIIREIVIMKQNKKSKEVK